MIDKKVSYFCTNRAGCGERPGPHIDLLWEQHMVQTLTGTGTTTGAVR